MSAYLMLEDIMEMMKMSKNKAQALFKTEGFPMIVIGSKWYVRADKFDAWMEEHEFNQTKEKVQLDYTALK